MRLLASNLIAVIAALAAAPARADGTLVTYPSANTTAPLPFVEYLPPGYTPGTAPERVVFFFHGVGESGGGTVAADIYNALTTHGPLMMVKNSLAAGTEPLFANTHRAIVLAARNPSGLWDNGLAGQFVDWALLHYRCDPNYVYLTGLSAGGGPSWNLVWMRPGVVAATLPVAPVVGAYPPTAADAAAFRGVPFWAFHGFGDPVVNHQESVTWVNLIGRGWSGNPNLPDVMSTYPNQGGVNTNPAATDMTALYAPSGYTWQPGWISAGAVQGRYTMLTANYHGIWPAVYATPAVWDWLFGQKRGAWSGGGQADGGTAFDAGIPPFPDAGDPFDAGARDAGRADAGRPDAGAGAGDAGRGLDAGGADGGALAADAGGLGVDGGPDAGVKTGCASTRPDLGLLALALGLLAWSGRRRALQPQRRTFR